MSYYTYILYAQKFDSFYIGSTSDLAQRLLQHNSGMTKSTKAKMPWEIVYYEAFETRLEAIQRELFLKKQRNKSFYKRISGMT